MTTTVYVLLGGVLVLLLLILRNQGASARREISAYSEQVSREWEDAFELIAKHRGEVAFVFDSDSGSMSFSSHPATELLDYTSTADLPEGFSLLRRLIHPSEQSSLRELWERLRGNEEVDTSLRLIRPDGEYSWIQIIAIPSAHHGIIGILRDVQELYKERHAAEEARRLTTISTMAGGLAHEFNNHLTPVSGFIELALDYLGDDHPVSDGLKTAYSRAAYCTDLVRQIQSFGRHQVMTKTVIDLNRFLPTAMNVAMTAHTSEEQDIKVVREWTNTLPKIYGDPNRLREVLSQLVLNALEAIPDNGTLTIRAGERKELVGAPADREDDHIYIQIIDSGVGITPDIKGLIFDPFFTTHKDSSGRGLGLPMVQGIIAQHDGWMEVQSEQNKGTQVTLFLPVYHEPEEDLPVEATDTLVVLPAAPIGSMLVADDEPSISNLIRKTFESDGWKVDTRKDYNEVLETVVQNKDEYDLLILDITMPGPSPSDCLEQILNTHPNIPVLLISGYSRDDRIEGLISQAKADFLGKPFSTHDLIQHVDRLMSEKVKG